MPHKVIIKNGDVCYWCCGCNRVHSVPGARWNFNGSLESPTLSPSVRHLHVLNGVEKTDCHYFVKEGYIHYCGDCPHPLKGQNRPLLSVDQWPNVPGYLKTDG